MLKIQCEQKCDDTLKQKFEKVFDELMATPPAFLDVIKREELLEKTRSLARRHSQKHVKLVVLGIGGSSLGGRVIANAFGFENTIFFFENVDEPSFFKKIKQLGNLEQVFWVIVSKSGKTIETIALTSLLREYLANHNISLSDHAVVISDLKENPLTQWAHKQRIEILEIPSTLGGRFSVLSPVGFYPASFVGLDLFQFLAGAKEVLKNRSLFVDFCAHLITSFQEEKWITMFWVYSDLLGSFGLWFQQLWSESLGKKRDHEGKSAPRVSTPMALLGTHDQHSILQQIVEGARDKFIIFLSVQELETSGKKIERMEFESFSYLQNKSLGQILKAQREGTRKSLLDSKVPHLDLYLEKIDEYHLGALFLFLEMCVAMIGRYHNINTYDQPGVELSKKEAINILKSSPK